MPTYVCLVFGLGADVLRTESLEAHDDEQALALAHTLQKSVNGTSFELWQEGSKVSAFYGRGSQPLIARRPLQH
jgi:hypothetical protein